MYTVDERIVDVGDSITPELGASGRVEVVDLQDMVVVPGFADSHLHFTTTTLGLIDQRLDRVGSISEMLDVVREGVKAVPAGSFREAEKGTLEPGKLADFVVLADDPTVPGANIKEIRAMRTVHRGQDTYRSATP